MTGVFARAEQFVSWMGDPSTELRVSGKKSFEINPPTAQAEPVEAWFLRQSTVASGRRNVVAWMVIGFTALIALDAHVARASLQGIIGYSGKQSDTCAICHDDGVAPLVRFEGPARFAADTMAQFRFVVQSQGANQRFAGFNVAASNGLLSIDSTQGARVEVGELTHNAPQGNDGEGVASWTFTWCVPTGGNFQLFGSGNSVNGNQTRSGDASAETELEVRVTPPSGDINCDGRRSAADATAVFTSVTAGAGVCESPDAEGDAAGSAVEIDAVIALLFTPACES